jgi:hypothetical protein
MSSNTAVLRERIRNGAAWLDENQPGWRDTVVIVDLDLSEVCRCVLGQVFTPLVAAELSRLGHDPDLDVLNSDDYRDETGQYEGYLNGYSYVVGNDWEGTVLAEAEARELAFDSLLWTTDESGTPVPPPYDYDDMTREWRGFLKGEWT